MLANWLLCAVANTFTDHSFAFPTYPLGGGSVIADELTGETWPTEHVIAYPGPTARTGGRQLRGRVRTDPFWRRRSE